MVVTHRIPTRLVMEANDWPILRTGGSILPVCCSGSVDDDTKRETGCEGGRDGHKFRDKLLIAILKLQYSIITLQNHVVPHVPPFFFTHLSHCRQHLQLKVAFYTILPRNEHTTPLFHYSASSSFSAVFLPRYHSATTRKWNSRHKVGEMATITMELQPKKLVFKPWSTR